MDLSHTDLLKLLSVLEGELQAREVVIAVLKTEQTKCLLYPDSPFRHLRSKSINHLNQGSGQNSDTTNAATVIPKVGNKLAAHLRSPGGCLNNRTRISPNDPYAALFRDSVHAFDPNFDEYATSVLFHFQLKNLDKLVEGHRVSQCMLKNHLAEVSGKLSSVFSELEEERRRSESFDRKKMEEQIQQLERENESLRNQFVQINTALENEREREKKMILHLLSERHQLIMTLMETQRENAELMSIINEKQSKISEMIEGLEDESKRSLQMELDMDKISSEYKVELAQLKCKLSTVESHNQLLQSQLTSFTNGQSLDVSVADTDSASKVTSNQSVSTPVTVSTSTIKMNANASQQYTSSPCSPSSLITGTIVRPSRSHVQVTAAAFHNQSYNPTEVPPVTINNSSGINSTVAPASQPIPVKSQLTKSQSSDACIPSTVAGASVTTGAKVSVAAAVAAVEKVTQIMTKAPVVRKISAGSAAVPAARGAPPPVPPNKPILPAQALKEKSKLITQNSLTNRQSNVTPNSEGEQLTISPVCKQSVESPSCNVPVQFSPNFRASKSKLPIKVYAVQQPNPLSPAKASNGQSAHSIASLPDDSTITASNSVLVDDFSHPPASSLSPHSSMNSLDSHFAPELADFHEALVTDVNPVNI